MYRTIKIDKRRQAFTLVELLVVIGIIVVLAALAASFAPRLSDDTKLSRAVDNLEQWLLTAKMRAKRDSLATGIRLVQAPGDQLGYYSQVQYIQQPDSLSGGWLSSTAIPNSVPYGTNFLTGGILQSAGSGTVTFVNVDFTLGGLPANEWLVQPGDYLEVRDGGVYQILIATATTVTLLNAATPLSYDASLTIATPTTNYRIHRQPRILIGEEPLNLPNNFAICANVIPNTIIPGCNVLPGASGNLEILFSPTGAVVGTNAATSTIFLTVFDTTMSPFDINRAGIVAVQSRTGFLGAYGVAAGVDPFYFARIARESGL